MPRDPAAWNEVRGLWYRNVPTSELKMGRKNEQRTRSRREKSCGTDMDRYGRIFSFLVCTVAIEKTRRRTGGLLT
jgi:hypothetical protein